MSTSSRRIFAGARQQDQRTGLIRSLMRDGASAPEIVVGSPIIDVLAHEDDSVVALTDVVERWQPSGEKDETFATIEASPRAHVRGALAHDACGKILVASTSADQAHAELRQYWP